MDTSDQIVADKSTVSLFSKTTLPAPDGSPRKDGNEANLSNKESIAGEAIQSPNSKRGQGKATSPKNVESSLTKKEDEIVGIVSSKRPLGSATNQSSSLEGHHAQTAIGPLSPTKPPSAAMSGGVKEKMEHLTPLEKDQSSQSEKSSPVASSSPTETNTKPRRTGSLPSSGFNFRPDERAHKRKEFNTKIEDKNRAKEAEKTVLEEKSKENADAEIKMFRKSLVFKASPLPSFYREPPPKVELKKTPPTRAKSPKFGRSNRSHCIAEAQNHVPSKGTSPQDRPRRESLPKLPPEDTLLTGDTEGVENQEWPETDQQASQPRPNHTDSLKTERKSQAFTCS